GANTGVTDTVPVVVNQTIAGVLLSRDALVFDALNAAVALGATAIDRLGSPIPGSQLSYGSGDSSIASVGWDGIVHARANGTTSIVARVGTDSAVAGIRVAQRAVRVLVPSDTLRFVALGETQTVVGIAVDSLGSSVAGGVQNVLIADTTVVRKLDAVALRALNNGATTANFSVLGLSARVTVVVAQIPESIDVRPGLMSGPI